MTLHTRNLIAQKVDEEDLIYDLLLRIFMYLDPISLYYLSLSCKQLFNYTQEEFLWQTNNSLVFSKSLLTATNSKLNFFKTINKEFPDFLNCEKEFYIAVKLNDLYSFRNRNKPINITLILLKRLDTDNIALWEHIQNNDAAFRQYVFDQLVLNELSENESKKLEWAIKLNIKTYYEETILKKKPESAEYINTMTCSNGDKLLSVAVLSRNIDCVKFLLNEGADPNAGRFLPIYYAAKMNQLEIVRLLCEKNAELNNLPGIGSPLYTAAKYGNFEVVKLLLHYGADIDTDVVYIANQEGHTEIVDYFFSDPKWLHLIRNNRGDQTELFMAAQFGQTKICEQLLQNGANADINIPTLINIPSLSKYTPLSIAATYGHTDVVKILLRYQPDLNIESMHGTALSIAASNGHDEIVSLLCEQKTINIELSVGSNDSTPLHIAAYKNHLKTIKILFNHGANINCLTRFQETPLHIAVLNKNKEIITFLLDKGADPNIKTMIGDTVLHTHLKDKASIPITLAMISQLLKKGADPLIRTAEKKLVSELTGDGIIKSVLELVEVFPEIIKPFREKMISSFGLALEIFTLCIENYHYNEVIINPFLEILRSQCDEEEKIEQLKQMVVALYSQLKISGKNQYSLFGHTKFVDALEKFIENYKMPITKPINGMMLS